MNVNNTLEEWLVYLENLHHKPIDLGLERMNQVRDRLDLSPVFPIIMVGGTNGKGSVCAILSTILKYAGYKVGTYTSPHVLHYRERIMVNLKPISDAGMVEQFAAIEVARQSTTLTPFEFLTLAAVRYFIQEKIDLAVLEVGLGGRFDAVNAFDANVAIVTLIDLDHCDWLGDTRAAIGYEKAGIFRAHRPAVVGDKNPPHSLCDYARKIGADLWLTGKHFYVKETSDTWSFYAGQHVYEGLCLNHLKATYQIHNASIALAGLLALAPQLPIQEEAIRQGLMHTQWPWRFQILQHQPTVILDVAHNPHGVGALVAELERLPKVHRQLAVFSMLADKDIDASIQLAQYSFDIWYIAGLDVPRGMTSQALLARFNQQKIAPVKCFNTLSEAWLAALSDAAACDRIVVFGSFHTIEAVENVRLGTEGCHVKVDA